MIDLRSDTVTKPTPELRRARRRLQQALEDTAAAITFQQLLEERAEKEKMYYI